MMAMLLALAMDEWTDYKCSKFGFSMLAPKGAKWTEREWEGGWGGLHAEVSGVELYGAARLGAFYAAEEIEKFGVRVTGIDDEHWTKIDEGKDRKGWRTYRTFKAAHEGTLVFGGYGTGPSGTFLLVLRTTEEDFESNEAQYQKWYESVRLHSCEIVGRGWVVYDAKEYGFSMLVPEGTKGKEREKSGGWGGFAMSYQGVELYGIAKLDEEVSAKDIEKYAVSVTGIPARSWEVIDQGSEKAGWKWYCTVRASEGEALVFGGYGVGPKGSYLLVLRTTKEDFRKHEADYRRWYASVCVR